MVPFSSSSSLAALQRGRIHSTRRIAIRDSILLSFPSFLPPSSLPVVQTRSVATATCCTHAGEAERESDPLFNISLSTSDHPRPGTIIIELLLTIHPTCPSEASPNLPCYVPRKWFSLFLACSRGRVSCQSLPGKGCCARQRERGRVLHGLTTAGGWREGRV